MRCECARILFQDIVAAAALGSVYTRGMDKRMTSRQLRRAAWWVAFAALAGFLLAELT